MVNFACTHNPPTTPTNPPSPTLSALLLGKFTSVGKSRLVHNRSVFLDLFLFLRDCHQSRFSFNRNQPFSHRDAAFGPKKVVDEKKSWASRHFSLNSLKPFIFHFFLGSPIWKPRDGGTEPQQENRGAPCEPPGVPPRPGSRANNVNFEGENLQAACKRTTTTHK